MKIDATMAVVIVRGLANLFSLTGVDTKVGKSLSSLADGLEAGVNVDAHMARVATALKSGAPRDWDEVHSRISADHKLLHTNDPIPKEEDDPEEVAPVEDEEPMK